MDNNITPIMNKHFINGIISPNIELVNLAIASAFRRGLATGLVIGVVIGVGGIIAILEVMNG